jgi:hypothetical protein
MGAAWDGAPILRAVWNARLRTGAGGTIYELAGSETGAPEAGQDALFYFGRALPALLLSDVKKSTPPFALLGFSHGLISGHDRRSTKPAVNKTILNTPSPALWPA